MLKMTLYYREIIWRSYIILRVYKKSTLVKTGIYEKKICFKNSIGAIS
jgi:hypothetical protein